ncbi:FecR family protein [Pedobacter sp. SYP-B3415]|uniref:FecR family protein n=1 Tax=Pedobacter sp. SYP-B3415 TaxID=2496641 RepID=UPI00101C4BFB|nr:FecR domain-containing protein [Pedobacter sp. SYP-B3415]
MEPNEPDFLLLTRFIDQQTSPEENEKVLAWLNASETNRLLYYKLKSVASRLQLAIHAEPDDRVWQRIKKAAALPEKAGHGRTRFLRYLGYAAVLCLLACCVLLYRAGRKEHWISVVVSENSKTRRILLPDSSEVWLEPGARLSYPSEFDPHGRNVILQGNAFFEVKKEQDVSGSRKPFSIKMNNMQVSVLGTSFHIYDGLQEQMVLVKTGLVKVHRSAASVSLMAGEAVRLQRGSFKKLRFSAALSEGLSTGNYRFDGTGIDELAVLLQVVSKLPVRIVQPGRFSEVRVSGRITATEADKLYSILGLMIGAKIEKGQKEIVVRHAPSK